MNFSANETIVLKVMKICGGCNGGIENFLNKKKFKYRPQRAILINFIVR